MPTGLILKVFDSLQDGRFSIEERDRIIAEAWESELKGIVMAAAMAIFYMAIAKPHDNKKEKQ